MCKRQRKGFLEKKIVCCNEKKKKVSPSARRQEYLGDVGVGVLVHRLKLQQATGGLVQVF